MSEIPSDIEKEATLGEKAAQLMDDLYGEAEAERGFGDLARDAQKVISEYKELVQLARFTLERLRHARELSIPGGLIADQGRSMESCLRDAE